MTTKQVQLAQKMRANGHTMYEIAEQLCVSVPTISKHLPKGQRGVQKKTGSQYPALNHYLQNHSLKHIATQLGISVPTVSLYFSGKRDMRKPVIDKLLKITGLTYEELFKEA